jgi:hypothetical protein
MYTQGKNSALYFEAPQEDPKWGIRINLRPTELKNVKDGQEITVRGRFTARKDGDVNMSNCSFVK